MFVGEYKHTIDEKNRIFIPSRLRSELGERFMVTKGFDRCLFVFPMAKWEAFAAKIAALPMVKNRRERLYFFSNAAECTLDSQGRVTVSPLLKEFAGIVKDVTSSATMIELSFGRARFGMRNRTSWTPHRLPSRS